MRTSGEVARPVLAVATHEHHAPEAPPRGQLLWPDYTRIIAICMVVVIHTVGGSVTHTSVGTRMWWGASMLDAASSWAVPVFAMMSGALLLGSTRSQNTGSFYRRRLVRIGVPTVVWSGIYLAWRHWVLHQHLGVRGALRLTLSGFPYYHLYFLFVILGLYAVTPFLRVLVQNISRAQLIGLVIGCLFWTWFNSYLGLTLKVPVTSNALTFFLPYIGYFLAGYLLRDVVVSGWLLVAVIGLLLATVVGQVLEMYVLGGALTPLGKYSALTIAMSMLAFVALLQLGRVAAERGCTGRSSRAFANAAFGVYLLHPIVISLLLHGLGITLAPGTVGQIALVLPATIVLTWAAILAIQRVPLLKRAV